MKLSNQIKSDRATYQRLDKKKRWLFIWDYYKIPILSVVAVLAILVIILTSVKPQDTVLNVVMVNADNQVESTIIPDLLKKSGVDLTERKIDIDANYSLKHGEFADTDMQTLEVLGVRFGIGDLDVFTANEDVFKSYAVKDAFVDLSLFIPKDILSAHEADLYRYKNTDGHEIVGGVWLHEGSPLHKAGYYHGDVLIGAVALAENLDNALLLIQQLLA